MEASEAYLDDALCRHHVDGKAHTHLLITPATLRGQQEAVYLQSCPPSLEMECVQVRRVTSAGDGNCAYYSVFNGLNYICGKVCTPATVVPTISYRYQYQGVCTRLCVRNSVRDLDCNNTAVIYGTGHISTVNKKETGIRAQAGYAFVFACLLFLSLFLILAGQHVSNGAVLLVPCS